MKLPDSKYIGFRAPADLAKAVEDVANRQCVPVSHLLRQAMWRILQEDRKEERTTPPAGYRWLRDDPAS